MTPKEVLYVGDALSNTQFLTKQCREAANQLQDPTLKQQAQSLADMHRKLYDQFYNLI